MSVRALSRPVPLPLHITPHGRWNDIGRMIRFTGVANPANGAWPANNRALYIPMRFDQPVPIRRAFSSNGTNAAGTEDIGIYGDDLALIASTGSTARSGTSVLQFIDIADLILAPGTYYWALVLSSTTGTLQRSALAANQCRQCGVLQEDLGGSTLPSTMTPALAAQGYVPVFGFTQSATL